MSIVPPILYASFLSRYIGAYEKDIFFVYLISKIIVFLNIYDINLINLPNL